MTCLKNSANSEHNEDIESIGCQYKITALSSVAELNIVRNVSEDLGKLHQKKSN